MINLRQTVTGDMKYGGDGLGYNSRKTGRTFKKMRKEANFQDNGKNCNCRFLPKIQRAFPGDLRCSQIGWIVS